MNQAADRSQTTGQLEAEGDVHQHQQDCKDRADECRTLQVAADRSGYVVVVEDVGVSKAVLLQHLVDHGSTLLGIDRGGADQHVLVAVTGGGYRGCVHTGCVLEQIADLGLDILRNGGVHVELHLGTAGKVDAQVEQVLAERQQDQRNKAGYDQYDRDTAKDLEVLEDREMLLLFLALAQAVSLRIADVEIHHASEQEVRDGQRGEHGHDNTDAQRGSEADDRAGAKEEQHAARDQGGDVGVQNCGERTLEAGVNGALDGLAGSHFLLDALKDNDVCVNRHTDGQDDTCNARQGQVYADQAEQQRLDNHVEAQSEAGNNARNAVHDDHEQHNEYQTDQACLQAGAHRVSAELRADRAKLYLLERERDLTCVDEVCQLGRAVAGEVAGDNTAVVVDLLGNRRIRDDLVIHHDVQNVGAVRTGSNRAGRLSELLLALAGKLHLNVMLIGHAVRRVAVAVGRLLDVRAGQPLLAVGIEEGQLSGGAQGLNRFLRVGDLRDLNRYAVLAAEGYGSLGKALVGQTLTNDLLYRVHVVGQVVGVVAVRDFGLVYDTGAADQIQTQTDTVVGIEYARDNGLQTGVFRVCGIGRSRVSRGVSRRIRAVCLVVRLVCAAVGRRGIARIRRRRVGRCRVPERHGPAARNVHSCYRRHAEENDDQHDRDKGSYTLFHLQVPPLIFLLHN